MFASCSPGFVVGRKAEKKTESDAALPARNGGIVPLYVNVNRVTRIGAFSWQHPKKLPWVEAVASELAFCFPVKADPAKRFTLSLMGGWCGGVTRPSGSLADWRPGYTSFSATAQNFADAILRVKLGTAPFGSPKKAGATTDPRYGCSVNTPESVGRLIRLHTKPEGRCGLNGWGFCALDTQARSNSPGSAPNPTTHHQEG